MNVVVMDFEFTMIHRTDIVLISGAMSNSHPSSPIIKINGNPIILKKESNYIQNITKAQEITIIRSLHKIFKNKEDKLQPILGELKLSIEKHNSNLTPTDIRKFLYQENKIPIIITWNGHTDKEILRRLQINCNILNITCYDNNNNGIFYLKITNIHSSKTLAEINIGKQTKNGRSLNLEEAHRAICEINHNDTYLHDPAVDVRITKCIYKFIIITAHERNNQL
jgi:hypothetical protein